MADALIRTLARMKIAVLRHNLHGARLNRFRQSVVFGLVAVFGTTWIALQQFTVDGQASDVMAIILLVWTIGWLIGPVLFSGEDRTLLPEHFRSLPLSSRQLVTGLLGASFVGVPAMVSLLAFLTLAIYAAKLDVALLLVAIPAAILQLVFAVAISKVTIGLMREYTQSQFAAAVGALITGAIAAFLATGWALLATTEDVLANGFSNTVSMVLHILPSGWAVVAVDAVNSGQWLLAAAAFLGLVGLTLLTTWVWAKLLLRRLVTRRTRPHRSTSRSSVIARKLNSPIGAVIQKELLAWRRDYTRSSFMYFALFYSLFVCLYPAANGAFYLLPFAGLLFIVSAVGSTANIYGADGSALWSTLVTTQAARRDVRGRQWAWLIITLPAVLLTTILPVVLTGYYWALPITIPLSLVTLIAGAGLVVANSVYNVEPMTDPHKRGDNAYEHSISWWQFVSLLIVLAILAAPTAGLVTWGLMADNAWAQWLSIPVALLTGIFFFWFLGRLTYRRLEASGPELLQTMLRGTSDERESAEATPTKFDQVYKALPWYTKLVFNLCMVVAPVAIFPQAVVPAIFKLIGEDGPVWFLPLFLPEAWQWPAILAMFGVGTLAILALRGIYRVYAKRVYNGTLKGGQV